MQIIEIIFLMLLIQLQGVKAMKDELTIKDFSKFFMDNIKLIMGTIIMFTLTVGIFVTYFQFNKENSGFQAESSVNLTKPPFDEERYEEMAQWPLELYSESQIKQMQEYLLPHAYMISIYVEHENHEPIANTTFMREVFRNDEIQEYIENQLDEKLTPAIDFAIHIENLGNSGVYELHFQRGTKEESLELAQVIVQAIESNEIPVLNNKIVEIISDEPSLVVKDYSEYLDSGLEKGKISLGSLIRNLLVYSILASVVGLIVGLVFSLVKMLFSKRISSLFNYEWDFTDRIVRLDTLSLKDDEILEKSIQNILYPSSNKKLILAENLNSEKYKKLFTELQKEKNIIIKSDFSELEKDQLVDEIILLSTVQKTTKSWYKSQRTQLSGYNKSIKVIQL